MLKERSCGRGRHQVPNPPKPPGFIPCVLLCACQHETQGPSDGPTLTAPDCFHQGGLRQAVLVVWVRPLLSQTSLESLEAYASARLQKQRHQVHGRLRPRLTRTLDPPRAATELPPIAAASLPRRSWHLPGPSRPVAALHPDDLPWR